jgi:hypothetical protein
MTNRFWNEKRNKYKFYLIFKFVGLEFTRQVCLNRNVKELFRSEVKLFSSAKNAICWNVNQAESEFDGLMLFSFQKVLERAANDNETFHVDFFIKLLLLDRVYRRFGEIMKYEIEICNCISDQCFINYLEMYLCLSYYIDRSMNFKYLKVNGCKFEFTKMVILRDFLLSLKGIIDNDKHITFIDNNNKFTHRYKNDLLSLSLDSTVLDEASIIVIAEMMDKNLLTSLELLNNISNVNLFPIFKAIHKINKLILDNIIMNESCYQMIANILPKCNANLCNLTFSNGSIQPDQLTSLLDSLQYCQRLQFLTISKCSLDDKDSKVISCFLKSKVDLNTLDISENNISNKGTKTLLMTLSNHDNKLKTLILNSNIIDHNIATKLVVLFRTNRYLTNIELNCSKLNKETLEYAMQNRSGDINSQLCRMLTFKHTNWMVKCSNLCDLCN